MSEGKQQPFHVESEDDCEVMLCGVRIPVDGPDGGRGPVIQSWWGPKKCPDCFVLFGRLTGSLP